MGKFEYAGEALIGIFYDFKQDQQRRPSPDFSASSTKGNYVDSREVQLYYKKIEEFIYNRYDEGLLSSFFRAPRALYTTQIFITNRPATAGPKAFGVENIVKPTLWLAHYKGQVIPPKAGKYEFVAAADGFIAVAINGDNVLVKHNDNTDKYLKQVGGKMAGEAALGRLRPGLPFESDGKTPLDLDILLAEAGGVFNAFLLYRREGETYAKDKGGHEILPVFQLMPYKMPAASAEVASPYAPSLEYWKVIP